MAEITTQVISSFDDPAVNMELWDRLSTQGDTDNAVIKWHYQRHWWQQNAKRGKLFLITAQQGGETKAIAPFFTNSGMVYNLCPVNTLDFVGDVSEPDMIDAVLLTAMRKIEKFAGFCFYFIPHTSRTSTFLQESAVRLGLTCVLEDDQPRPIINIANDPEAAVAITRKKSLVRCINRLRREGDLQIRHFYDYSDVESQMDTFYDQHIARWSKTSTPSRFLDKTQREHFTFATQELADRGGLRFSRLDWNGQPIAFHRGSCYKRHFNYGRTTFAPELERYSPGTALLHYLLLAAIEEDAEIFDFGFGAEAYKYRYANDEIRLQTWGLYP